MSSDQETSDELDDQPTPAVPPTGETRITPRETDIKPGIEDREQQDVPCPHCGAPRYHLIEKRTGAKIVVWWDAELFDIEKFSLEDSWPEVKVIEHCESCGYRRDIA